MTVSLPAVFRKLIYTGGSVMMWAAISNNSKTELVHVPRKLTVVGYGDKIIQPHLINVIDRQLELFQHDNARPRQTPLAMDYLEQNNINVLPWLSKSPELNPIEQLWDHLDKRCARVNLHLRPLINSDKCCNRNSDQYHEIMLEN
jgi:hypothetical protein